jgi:D-amino peptidase
MKAMARLCVQVSLWLGMMGLVAASVLAEPYELSKNDVMDPKAIKSPDISLFGVKIGDTEALFIFLVDQRKPTGPMAGVRVQDGKVDMIFINNRFAYKTRGLFRNVLNSESPEDIRKLLGNEDYGDENVMGAVLAYDKQGFVINYLGKDVNIEFSPVH